MAKINDIKSYIHYMKQNYMTDGSSALAVEAEAEEVPPAEIKNNADSEKIKEKNVTQEEKSDIIKNLVYGEDYGKIPKVEGNVLFKKGALKIIKMKGCKHHMELVEKNVDVANGFIGYTVKVTIVDNDGGIVTEAFGSANTLEKKFAGKGFAADSMLIGMASKRALVECAKELILC